MLRLGPQTIDIPAGRAKYVVTDSYTLPVDVGLEAVQPHAHYPPRDVRGEAMLPDGSRKPSSISPTGTSAGSMSIASSRRCRCRGARRCRALTYDNSAANPATRSGRPFARAGVSDPPRNGRPVAPVRAARRPRSRAPQPRFRQKAAAEDVGLRGEIEKQPGDVGLHDDAALPTELGQTDGAMSTSGPRPCSTAVAIPNYNLGTALTGGPSSRRSGGVSRGAAHRFVVCQRAQQPGNVLLSQKRR